MHNPTWIEMRGQLKRHVASTLPNHWTSLYSHSSRQRDRQTVAATKEHGVEEASPPARARPPSPLFLSAILTKYVAERRRRRRRSRKRRTRRKTTTPACLRRRRGRNRYGNQTAYFPFHSQAPLLSFPSFLSFILATYLDVPPEAQRGSHSAS